jgi:hypothetical protein
MSSGKLRLGPLPKAATVKLTVTMRADLRAMLDQYAAEHSRVYDEPVDAVALVPYILEAFMERDRAFKPKRSRVARPVRPSD